MMFRNSLRHRFLANFDVENTRRQVSRRALPFQLAVERLEDRTVPATWVPLTNQAPEAIGTMLLLTDGTVIANGGGSNGVAKSWFKLTPAANGSYLNGTWSTLASMSTERLYYGSNVLPDGRVYVLGGEYSGPSGAANWTNTGEIYDPVTNTWTPVANFPKSSFGDGQTLVMPDGRILAGYLSSPENYLYNVATNTWTQAGSKIRNDRNNEENWTLLPDSSVLTVEIWSVDTAMHSQRYIPATDTWVDAGDLPYTLTDGDELGPAPLLNDGRVFAIGEDDKTALWNFATGTWGPAPDLPAGTGADDAPGATLPNGHVLFTVDTPDFNPPTLMLDFDPVANTVTDISSTLPAALQNILAGTACFQGRMLMLPTGEMLFAPDSFGERRPWLYTPDGGPLDAWRPTVSTITPTSLLSYHLTGTQINGMTEGAYYGDDAVMSTNYPVVSLTSGTGQVIYAKTTNWAPGKVATGSQVLDVDFDLPAGTATGTYSLVVSASGIRSLPITIIIGNPPTISDIPDQLIPRNSNTGALAFVVGDVETPPAQLIVTGSSSNTALVPNANIVFGGSGANRTVTVTPTPNMSGVATITVTVTDGSGAQASDTLVVTVNDPPTISNITDRTINEDTSTGPIAFTIGDTETAASSLVLTRNSSNLTLVPLSGIVFGGSGANRTVTVTPAANQSGTATITVRVADGIYTISDTFVLTVGALNDPPSVTVGGTVSTPEDTSTFVTGISIADVDAGAAAVSLVLSVLNGTLTVSSSVPGGVPAGSITNNNTSSVTLLSTLARINTTLAAATGLTYVPNPNYSGNETLTVLVNDNGNTGAGGPLSTSKNQAITIGAVADPPFIATSNASGTEATDVPLNITVALTDTDGSEILTSIIVSGVPAFATLSAGIDNTDGTWTLTQAELAGLTYSPADDGIITLTVTAKSKELANSSTASAGQSFQVDITPVAPDLTVNAPVTGVRGQRIPFRVQPDDPAPVDQAAYFTFKIDWDANGTIDETVLALAGSIIPHAFPTTGQFTSRFTAADEDGLVSPSFETTINLSVFEIQPDPLDSAKTALVVGGTVNSDKIKFRPGPTPGSVIPSINGVGQGTFTPTGRIIAFGQIGNDVIKTDATLKLPVWFDGGLGDDKLTGGRMNDILQGQGGKDVINGGDGRDLVLGGDGLDSLSGGNHDDLLVAALTGFDSNDKALAAIHREWTSTRPYAQRVANLSGLAQDTSILVPIITVEDDNFGDILAGQSGQDWFFADLIAGNDKIGDAALNEVITS